MSRNDSLLSICIIVRNERKRIGNFLELATLTLFPRYEYYELLLLDNASNDGTDQIIAEQLKVLPKMRLLRLSRIYSLDTAVTAALDNAIGDYVILIDLDTDLALIHTLVGKAEEGNDIVVVRRNLNSVYSPFDRWMGEALYRLASRILGFEVVPQERFTRLFSRRAVNALTQVRSRRRYIRHFGAIVGYRHAYINVDESSDGAPQIPPINRLQKVSFIVNLVVNNSIVPLRFAALLGLFASFLSLTYLAYIVIVTIVREGQLAEGWLTTSVSTTSMFLILFIILAILTEYIGRLLEESKDEPLYFLEYEEHSTISSYSRTVEQQKLNIVQS